MRSVVLFCSIGFLVAVVTSGDWLSEQLALREDNSMLEDRIHGLITREMTDNDIPGLSVSIVLDQSTLMEAGFGMANLEAQIPATPHTVYRGGNLAQIFTVIAILQRAEHRKLDLDMPVSAYLPQFLPYNKYGLQLTMRQMLSHQSGLPPNHPSDIRSTHPTLCCLKL